MRAPIGSGGSPTQRIVATRGTTNVVHRGTPRIGIERPCLRDAVLATHALQAHLSAAVHFRARYDPVARFVAVGMRRTECDWPWWRGGPRAMMSVSGAGTARPIDGIGDDVMIWVMLLMMMSRAVNVAWSSPLFNHRPPCGRTGVPMRRAQRSDAQCFVFTRRCVEPSVVSLYCRQRRRCPPPRVAPPRHRRCTMTNA